MNIPLATRPNSYDVDVIYRRILKDHRNAVVAQFRRRKQMSRVVEIMERFRESFGGWLIPEHMASRFPTDFSGAWGSAVYNDLPMIPFTVAIHAALDAAICPTGQQAKTYFEDKPMAKLPSLEQLGKAVVSLEETKHRFSVDPGLKSDLSLELTSAAFHQAFEKAQRQIMASAFGLPESTMQQVASSNRQAADEREMILRGRRMGKTSMIINSMAWSPISPNFLRMQDTITAICVSDFDSPTVRLLYKYLVQGGFMPCPGTAAPKVILRNRFGQFVVLMKGDWPDV